MAIVLTIGHQGGQPGSSGNGLVEAAEVRKVAEGVLAILRQPAYKDLNWRQTFTDGIHEFEQIRQEYLPGDIGITIHINAGGGTGTETYYCTSGERAVAQQIQDAVVGALELPNRGVKDGSGYQVANLAREQQAGIVLLELFFIDDASDVARYKERFDKLVAAIARSIIELCGGTWTSRPQTKFNSGDFVLLPDKTCGKIVAIGHDGHNAVANVNGRVLFQWELIGVGDPVVFQGREGFTVEAIAVNAEGHAVVRIAGAPTVFATEISK